MNYVVLLMIIWFVIVMYASVFDFILFQVFLFQLQYIFSKRQIAWQNVDFGPPRKYAPKDVGRSIVDLLPLSINRIRLVGVINSDFVSPDFVAILL